MAFEVFARPERHLFISPHYDDIALSCGGTAALLSQNDREPVIALVFGSEPAPNQKLTSFAAGMHRQWGLAAREVIAGRRREEAAASAILGARDELLPFHDAIYRGDRYTSDEKLFGPVAADKQELQLPRELMLSLGLGGIPDNRTRIYAPLAVGNHVDHQIAFTAGTHLAEAGWDVFFYEDLPYAIKLGAVEIRVAATNRRLSIAARIDVSSVWQTKMDAIMAYPSQLGVIFGYVDTGVSREEINTVMRAHAEKAGNGIPVERFWMLA
jgi:LmbE family N-acetylglucosaminyl deacetylase